jgi:hypothetical protein
VQLWHGPIFIFLRVSFSVISLVHSDSLGFFFMVLQPEKYDFSYPALLGKSKEKTQTEKQGGFAPFS